MSKQGIGARHPEKLSSRRSQRSERSRQLIENKDLLFSHVLESRQLAENRLLSLLKAVNILKLSLLC
jgi:hypothetical protein